MRLAAGAATAGVAYHAGKRQARQDAEGDQASYDAGAAQASAYAPPPPAARGSASDSSVDDLNRLVELHDSGGLSDDEFAAAKAKLLGL